MSKVELRELTRETYLDAFRLKVRSDQEGLVADNISSLAEAYFHEGARPFGIYRKDELVGFVMLSLEDIAERIVWVWRMMIGEPFQRQGLGTQGMRAVISHVQGMPEADELRLSHSTGEGGAGAFYIKLGFTYTGEIEHGEPVMRLGTET